MEQNANVNFVKIVLFGASQKPQYSSLECRKQKSDLKYVKMINDERKAKLMVFS